MTMIKLTKHLKKIATVSAFVLVSSIFLHQGTASAATVDLKQYYPNPALYKNYYLEGFNYEPSQSNPTRTVLWFEETDSTGDNFKRYNTGPEDPAKRCGWDALSWAGDNLTYSQTHDGCGGHNKDVIYSNPIKFLPRYWDDTQDWTFTGSTPVVTTKVDGSTGCTGTNNYTATLVAGHVDIGGGLTAIHWVTEQNTDWAIGDDAPWCVHDSTTHWREDYYMVEALPVEGYTGITTAKALKRTVGGNLDNYTANGHHDWDIWFDKWVKLPWGVDPGLTTDTPNNPGVTNNNNTPTSPKTGQIGIATVALAALGGLLFVSALGVKKAYRKKKGLPATKPKTNKAPKLDKSTDETPKSK